MDKSQQILRAAGIGVVSGMRTMTGPASVITRSGGKAALTLPLLALAEMIADKIPGIPSRTVPPALLGRTLAGAVAGYWIVGENGDRRIGVLAGIAGAVAGAYLMAGLRKTLVAKTHLPDALVGLAEDALAAGAGMRLSAA